MSEKCAVCRFVELGKFDQLECRRNPPIIALPHESAAGVWPEVEEGGWCGEFQIDPELEIPEEQQLKDEARRALATYKELQRRCRLNEVEESQVRAAREEMLDLESRLTQGRGRE